MFSGMKILLHCLNSYLLLGNARLADYDAPGKGKGKDHEENKALYLTLQVITLLNP